MFAYSLVLFLFIFSDIFADDVDTHVVQTEQGKIEGKLAHNGLYHEFLGVPYGIPVKFRAPKPPKKHKGVFKADIRDNICPQFPSNDPLAAPSDNEDCLTLNIYSPINIIGNTSLPVMLFLHGGGFGVGSGSPMFYGPQYLVSHGVIIVTINYRLNAYGFLNLGIEDAPGNAGLKDIRQALRWVKKNIKNFGGDEENVTVFGQGSGGIAALYLTLSSSCHGLFKRVISESGTLLSPHSFDATPLNTASHLAKSLGLNTEDPEELYQLYSETPILKVEEAISKQMNPKTVFLPSIELEFEDEEAFLIDAPYKILTEKNHKEFNPVSVIIGINTVEGLTSTLDYNTITSQMDRIKNEDYSALDQRNFKIPKDEKEEFRNMLKDTYFTNSSTDESVIGGIINLNSDFSYVGPMALFAEIYANNSGQAVFEYIFNYIGNRNLGRLLTNSSLPATTNLDELFYLFELERLPLPMDENDARIVTFMTMLWTNFAKFGNPTPDPTSGSWLPHPHRLAVALTPQYVSALTPERAHFANTLYMQYGVDTV